MKAISKLKFVLIMFAIMLASAIILFCAANFSFNNADALIEGLSGNRFVITGLVGNRPQHYFVNDNGESTLQNIEVENTGQTHYSIVPSSKSAGIYSGWGELATTTDVNELIKKGVVYAEASATITSNYANDQSNIIITLSQGEKSVTAQSSNGANETSTITTELLQLTDSSRIRFSFQTVGSGVSSERSSFIMEMPTIRLYTIIDEVYLENEDQEVTPGQTIKINAYNEITNVNNVMGNFISYSKVNHQIKYQFLSGGEYADVAGDNLVLNSSIPDGTVIQLRAYCYKSSISSEVIYSDRIVTFTVNANKVNVEILTDFENPATIIGEGQYDNGQAISLTVQKTNEGFTFDGWYINGELETTKTKLTRYIVTAGDVIYAKFTKTISIASIEVLGRVYDGTTNINSEDIIYNFNGVENNHQLSLEGIEVKYANANAGTNKAIEVSYVSNVTLTGEDSDIYRLSSQIVPSSFGTIYQREVEIYPNVITKQYGYSDPVLTYEAKNVVSGDVLLGSLGRESGEKIGEYDYNLGTLSSSNPNYTFTIAQNGAKFSITKRTISLNNVYVEDKIYDKTVNATIVADLSNVVNGEDVSVSLSGNFVSANVGNDIEVVIDTNSIVLSGKDKDNYILSQTELNLKGNILPKTINVIADQVSAVYGDKINFTYSVEGLLDGDSINVDFYVDEQGVGEHDIRLSSQGNANYTVNFISAKCNITPKDITVYANAASKTYGDSDPELTFTVEGLVGEDKLSGSLAREDGEDFGEYEITIGSLNNSNYNINLQSNSFSILKRDATANITFKNKIYDGTCDVDYIVSYDNTVLDDEFVLSLNVSAEKPDSGVQDVEYEIISIDGEKAMNYNFKYNALNSTITIERRNVQIVVNDASKTYGEEDPELSYYAINLVEGDSLAGDVKRNEGEDVGGYTYYLDTLNNENNPNYNISLRSTCIFTINPKNVVITTEDYEKVFGDEDPDFTITLAYEGQLCFDDKAEEILDGTLSREEGENVGIYNFIIDNVSSSKNYTFSFEQDRVFIINKRPVIVTCDKAVKIYGDEDPNYTYSVENEVEGESLMLDIRREYGENVGEYKLVLSSSIDPRYSITFISNYLEIVPSDITVKAERKVKIYGDEDPSFTVVVTEGVLKNNDIITNISQGQMEREEGENVGLYTISQGSFSLGDNYNVTFESDQLEIIAQPLTISAKYTTKSYGDKDPVIGYELTSGQLKFDDDFVGALARDEGESVGKYNIILGSLAINENYNITLITNTFEILKRTIEIVPSLLSKTYGDEEPVITYQIIGSLVEGDELEGELYRDRSQSSSENVGSYDIVCSLSNSNYEIIFGSYYFEIVARPITIKADDIEITYGDAEPTLTYQITSGNLIGEDKISGSVYRIPGNNVGSYAIRSSLTLGKNYSVTFINGTFTIKPLDLVLKVDNYEKEYGQIDPIFTYSIESGKLINGDTLHGEITRVSGEDVGNYKLESNIYNSNYNITINEAYLTITPKNVYLVASIYDKVYDGTTVATLRNPYVTGLIDSDVVLLYDRENCARFESSEIGNDINVYLSNISLFGTKASNYHLILPEVLTADITNAELESDGVKIESKQQAILYDGLKLSFSSDEISNDDIKIENHKSLLSYDIWLEGEDKFTQLNATVTLTIDVPDYVLENNNIYVYLIDESGQKELVSSQKDDEGNLVITTSNLGNFIITTDNDTWIDYGAFIGIGLVVVAALAVTIIMIIKKKKAKKQ